MYGGQKQKDWCFGWEQLTASIFETETLFSYSELCKKIQELLEVRDRQAKNYIKSLKDQALDGCHGILTKLRSSQSGNETVHPIVVNFVKKA